ncbi:MAG: hypothetical protein K2X82_15620 [Gemmataceae bacterium]|nr:hypothetical protein [Gemmataceae bacterium]
MTRFPGRLFRAPTAAVTAKTRTRLGLEALDRRDLPAVTADLVTATGLLTITGDGAADSVSLVEPATVGANFDLRGVSRFTYNGLPSGVWVPVGLVRSVRVSLGGGDDRFYMSRAPVQRNTAGWSVPNPNLGLLGVVSVDAGDGADWVHLEAAVPTPATVAGGSGNDTVRGGSGPDLVFGGAGNDDVEARDGADTLVGNTGNDWLDGGAGNDTLWGRDGEADTGVLARRETDADVLRGGAGDDALYGQVGNDSLGGDDGNDSVDGGAGTDILYGGAGNDLMRGGAGNDLLYGGNDNDTLDGGAGNDTLYGERGDDVLLGRYGSLQTWMLTGVVDIDRMDGGDGNDFLDGQLYWDAMDGGAGLDYVVGRGWE